MSRREGKTQSALIEAISAFLAEREEVEFAYLFGSRAMGYHRPDSDVDLAVFLGDETSPWTGVGLEETLSQCVGHPAQVISLDRRLRPHFLHGVLSTGVVVKDSPGREKWENEIRQLIERGMNVGRKDAQESYRRQLLTSMEEKARKVLHALPLLDGIDLEQVKEGEPEAVRDFLGTFLMLFEPVETIARKMANYSLMAPGDRPSTLKEQMKLVVDVLGLSDEVYDQLGELAGLRNRLAHAYWDLAEDEIAALDLEKVKDAFESVANRLSVFISEQERSNDGKE